MLKGNNEDTTKIQIAPSNILGLKVSMEVHSKDKGKVNDHLVYGIKHMRLYADTKGVNL